MRMWVAILVMLLTTSVMDCHHVSAAAEPVVNAITVEAPERVEMLAPKLVQPPDLLDYMSETDAYWLSVEVNAAAAEYNVPVRLCWEVIRAESTFHHIVNGAIKKNPTSGALGICQILLDGMAIKKRHNILERADNIRCMAEMLSFALETRGYGLERALGWYNTGSPIRNPYARQVAKRYCAWARQDGEEPIG